MTALEITLGIILLVMAVFLMVAVILQSGKDKKSGVISGGAETFFGKNKARSMDGILAKCTAIVAVLFILTSIVLFIITK